MTPERIAELKRLCDAATEGPWFTGAQNDMLFVIDGAPSPSPYDGTIPKVCGPSVVCTPNWRDMPFEANAAFIAAAREALPEALAEVERLTAENATARALAVNNAEGLAEATKRALAAEAERDRLRAALADIAAYNDRGASEDLAETGSYSMFDEPCSVETARAALEQKP